MKRVTKVIAVFLMVVGFAGAARNLIATFGVRSTIDGPVLRVETEPLIAMVFGLAIGGRAGGGGVG